MDDKQGPRSDETEVPVSTGVPNPSSLPSTDHPQSRSWTTTRDPEGVGRPSPGSRRTVGLSGARNDPPDHRDPRDLDGRRDPEGHSFRPGTTTKSGLVQGLGTS